MNDNSLHDWGINGGIFNKRERKKNNDVSILTIIYRGVEIYAAEYFHALYKLIHVIWDYIPIMYRILRPN